MAISKNSVGKLTLVKIAATILTILYSIIQVHIFGVSREIEIYFAAITLLHTLISITQAGQLSEVYLPIYHKIAQTSGIAAAHRSFSVVLNWMTLAIAALCLITTVLAPQIVDILVPGFSVSDKLLAIAILRTTIILLLVDVYNSFIRTLLNAEGVYGKAELVDVFNTVISIAVLLIFYDKFGIWTLVFSLMLGKIISFIIYVAYLNNKGIHYYLCFRTEGFEHKKFFMTIFNTSLYVIATQFYVVILTSQLSLLPQGIFATFKYVQNLYAKLRGVAIQPLMTVFFTNVSKQIQNKSSDLLAQIKPSIRYFIILNVLIIILSFSFGDTALGALWGNDKFGGGNLQLAYWLFILNCIALLISSISGIYRKIVVSYGLANKLYFSLIFSQLLTALIVYLLVNTYGVEGLKLIIPLNVIFLGIVPFVLVYSKDKNLLNAFSLKLIVRILILSVLVAPIGRFLNSLIPRGDSMMFIERLWTVSYLLLSASATVVIFIILGRVFKITEFIWMEKKIKTMLKIKLK